jgi:hypothetical protein
LKEALEDFDRNNVGVAAANNHVVYSQLLAVTGRAAEALERIGRARAVYEGLCRAEVIAHPCWRRPAREPIYPGETLVGDPTSGTGVSRTPVRVNSNSILCEYTGYRMAGLFSRPEVIPDSYISPMGIDADAGICNIHSQYN